MIALLAQRMSELRSHGITKDEESFIFTPDGPWSYEQQNLGFNYRMTDFQAALGLSQLNRIDEFVQDRNAQLDNYRHLISDLPIHLLEVPKNVTSSVHLAVIRLHEVTAASIVSSLKVCVVKELEFNCTILLFICSLTIDLWDLPTGNSLNQKLTPKVPLACLFFLV